MSASRMLRLVARLERKNLLRDRVFWLALALFAVLVGFAGVSSRRVVTDERATAQRAALAQAERLEELRASRPDDPLRVGQELLPRVAALPGAPLAPLSVGPRELAPQTVKLTTRPQTYEGSSVDAMSGQTGPFDLAFVLVYLLPLLVIGATFDLLAREREQGTLALVLSQPISAVTFLLGKAATRFALLLGATWVLALAGVLIGGAALSAPGAGTALALLFALTAAYVLFWFAAALWVNARGKTSAGNALTLMVLWLGLVVVVPGLASVAVDAASVGPSRAELLVVVRDAARESDQALKRSEGNHGAARRDASEVLALEREFEMEIAPVVRAFNERRRTEDVLVERVRFVSPALLASEGLADLAGSGAARRRHFHREVDRFHVQLRAFFEPRVRRGAPLEDADYAAVPSFHWVEPPVGGLVSRTLTAVLALVVASAALVWMAVQRLRRPLFGS